MNNCFSFKSIRILERFSTGFKVLCKLESPKLTKEIKFDYYKDDSPKSIINELKENVNISINNEKEFIQTIGIFNNLNTRIKSISNINN